LERLDAVAVQLHDGPFAELLLDLLDGPAQRRLTCRIARRKRRLRLDFLHRRRFTRFALRVARGFLGGGLGFRLLHWLGHGSAPAARRVSGSAGDMCGDLEAVDRTRVRPRQLNSTEVTRPPWFSVCSGWIINPPF